MLIRQREPGPRPETGSHRSGLQSVAVEDPTAICGTRSRIAYTNVRRSDDTPPFDRIGHVGSTGTIDPVTALQGTPQGAKPAPKADAPSDVKEKKTTAKDREDGTVESIDKAKNMFLVRTRPDGNLPQVIVNSQTVYSVQNKAGSVDDLRSGGRVICTGQFNDKGQLAANRCEMRDAK